MVTLDAVVSTSLAQPSGISGDAWVIPRPVIVRLAAVEADGFTGILVAAVRVRLVAQGFGTLLRVHPVAALAALDRVAFDVALVTVALRRVGQPYVISGECGLVSHA